MGFREGIIIAGSMGGFLILLFLLCRVIINLYNDYKKTKREKKGIKSMQQYKKT